MKKRNWLIIVFSILLTGITLLVGCGEPTTTTSQSPSPTVQPSTTTQAATTTTANPTTSASPTATTSAPPVASIQLKLNLKAPPTLSSTVEPFKYFASEVEKRTNGRVKVTLYLASALAKASESYDAVLKGVADLSDGTPTDTPGRFPASAIADLPYNVPSVWVAAHTLNDWFNKFNPKEYDGVHVLFLTTNPPALLGTARKAVKSVDDIKGLSIRTPGEVETEELKALGAIPRSIPSGEISQALSKGNIDGCLISPEGYPAFKLNEVINYVTDISEFASVHITYLVMNKDVWNKLTADDQKTLQAVAYETMEMRAKLQDKDLITNIAAFKAMSGKQWITLASGDANNFKTIIQSVADTFVSKMVANGLPATDYANYIKERIQYWITQPPK